MIDQKDSGPRPGRAALPPKRDRLVFAEMDDATLQQTVRDLTVARDNVIDVDLRARVTADLNQGTAEVARRSAIASWAVNGQPTGQHRREIADAEHTEVLAPVAGVRPLPAVESDDMFIPLSGPDAAQKVAQLWTEGWPAAPEWPAAVPASVRPEWTPEAFVRLQDELAKPAWLGWVRARLTVARALVLTASASVLVGAGAMWLVTR
ncbi:hypothetical protein [Amycolatopsis tolypomycina]|uniref:hypothetical protein n=1 Tax=Amycolatopsis tolypomycina TaxID=208445 RepID=UPI0033B001E1